MKKLLLTTLLLPACLAAGAHSLSPHKVKAAKPNPHKQTTAIVSQQSSAIYVGTNDFYLALVREGVSKG